MIRIEKSDSASCSSAGKWAVEPLKENKVPGDQGLVLKSRAKHHAVAAMLDKPFVFKEKPLVVQWVVNLLYQRRKHGADGVKLFGVLIAGTRWTSRTGSTAAELISNCSQTMEISTWLVSIFDWVESRLSSGFLQGLNEVLGLLPVFVKLQIPCLLQKKMAQFTTFLQSQPPRLHQLVHLPKKHRSSVMSTACRLNTGKCVIRWFSYLVGSDPQQSIWGSL